MATRPNSGGHRRADSGGGPRGHQSSDSGQNADLEYHRNERRHGHHRSKSGVNERERIDSNGSQRNELKLYTSYLFNLK